MDTDSPHGPVVVGVDGSAPSRRAVQWAAAEAASWQVPLHLVNAWLPPVPGWAFAGMPEVPDVEMAQKASTALLEEAEASLRAELGDQMPEIIRHSLMGQPAHQLIEASRDARALVLGTRGQGGFAGLLLGAVVAACLHHTVAPLVAVGGHLVPPGAGAIVVGVDASDGARRALRWAAEEAARHGALLRVVHGWESAPVTPPGPQAFGPDPEEFAVSADRFLNEFVADVLAELGIAPEVECLAAPAPAAEALLWEARGAAMLVVGSRGRGGFAGLLLGSVSRQCANHSPCPVAIIPQ